MPANQRSRAAPRTKRAYSVRSDTSFTPAATPTARRAGVSTRGVRAITVESDATAPTQQHPLHSSNIPPCYALPPTTPCPFAGTLEASLDAVLEFSQSHHGLSSVVSALLQPVDTCTNWPLLLRAASPTTDRGRGRGRGKIQDILFLVTRTLLPEQVKENRAAMARMYERKKHLAIRVVLRYDMLGRWKVDAAGHVVSVPSLALRTTQDVEMGMEDAGRVGGGGARRHLLPNIIPTLIAAPKEGWTTHGVRERMKHHVTALDKYLLLGDDEVAGWDDDTQIGMTAQIILQWQWLRKNNEMLEEMEAGGWEALEGRADECEWVAEDVKRKRGAKVDGGGGGGGGRLSEKKE